MKVLVKKRLKLSIGYGFIQNRFVYQKNQETNPTYSYITYRI